MKMQKKMESLLLDKTRRGRLAESSKMKAEIQLCSKYLGANTREQEV